VTRSAIVARAARQHLNREVVLRAALALVDREGVEALSMRRLGRELGVEAMSLYNHVAGKQALLDGIVELVLSQARAPAPRGEWRAALTGWAAAFRASAHEHPNVIRLFATHALQAPAWSLAVEDQLRALREAGFPDDEAVHAYRLVATFVTGYALYELRQDASPPLEHFLAQLPPEHYPHTHAVSSALRELDRTAEFELGVQLLLDAVGARLPAGPRRRRGGAAP
jgi:TetR/AcrR family transcriptional regulator, tetracycline repressor protein